MATKKAEDTAGEKPAVADWPEHPNTPAYPQFAEQLGARRKVRANVSVLNLTAGQVGEVFDHPEVDALITAGLLEAVADDAPLVAAPTAAQETAPVEGEPAPADA